MMERTRFSSSVIVFLVAIQAVLSSDSLTSEHLQEELLLDDECSTEGKQCALEALQVRGSRISPQSADFQGDDLENGIDVDELQGSVDLEGAALTDDDEELPADMVSALEAGVDDLDEAAALEGSQGIMILYHQTSRSIAKKILRSGFRRGHAGWCGGAIYFATTPGATGPKAIGRESHHGAVLACTVDVGRVRPMPPTCTSSPTCHGVHCLSHRSASGWLRRQGFDSIAFNPGGGVEYVIFNPRRVRHCHILR
eukprot:TRINITY_DN93710_c0_g1_i1.p1 TRINITY_DN93710_c0_g1~~TRINITY_DN93710_c0_g1_i1.p1  ORF type:complete len:254 (-),score=49.00 TRINITY_DN93710_c0_g1_i1:326-1087(-)